MTHEELISELRNSKGWPNLGNAAADRIEQLVKERDFIREAALREAAEVAWVYGFDKKDGIQKRILTLIGEKK
jgi:hypothetical protein